MEGEFLPGWSNPFHQVTLEGQGARSRSEQAVHTVRAGIKTCWIAVSNGSI